MHKPFQREWDLTIDPDTVRLFVLKAKAIAAGLNRDYEAGGEHEVELDERSRDGHLHDGLAEEEEEDLTERELRALINDLNVDEAAELIALAWIGRGEFDVAEWDEAVRTAKERNLRNADDYLVGMPLLADYLEEGLAAFGLACD